MADLISSLAACGIHSICHEMMLTAASKLGSSSFELAAAVAAGGLVLPSMLEGLTLARSLARGSWRVGTGKEDCSDFNNSAYYPS